MKWIGKHIVDLIARFRSDVYLDDINTGTIASGGNLGLDSNNKIVKANEASGGIAFDGSTANGVLTYKDADEATVESTLSYDGTTLKVGSDDGSSNCDVIFYSNGDASNHIGLHWNADYETEGGLIGGANHHGVDFKFFGESNGAYCEWDMSADTFSVYGGVLINTGPLTLDGNRDITPSNEGKALHIDVHTVTDTDTSTSGTVARYFHNVFESPTLAATNSSVTTSIAANLYIKDAPSAGTNQTLTSSYALWVDDGSCRFDGNILTSGTLKFGAAAGVATNDVYLYGAGAAAHVGLHWDVDGNTEGTLYGGVDDHGIDFKFFGETAGKYVEWDQSADTLTISGTTVTTGNIELGHATDTTLARSASGTVTIEGKTIATKNDYTYQYIPILGNSTVQANGDWEFPGGNGIANHVWTVDGNDSGTTVNSTTITVGKQYQHAGIRIPFAGELVGFYGAGRNASGNRTFAGALFVGTPDYGTANNITATMRAYAAADNNGGTFSNCASKLDDGILSEYHTLSAGDMIYPGIRGNGSNADTIQVAMTIVVRTRIP